MATNNSITTKAMGTGDNKYYLVRVGGTVVGHHSTKAQAAKQVMYLKRARKDIEARTKNPGKILTPGKWIKARAIRVHRGKLEILTPSSSRLTNPSKGRTYDKLYEVKVIDPLEPRSKAVLEIRAPTSIVARTAAIKRGWKVITVKEIK